MFLRLSSTFFSAYTYSIWHLTKTFNLHNAHQKSNRQTLFLYSEKQNNWQTIIAQKFRKGQKFRLTSLRKKGEDRLIVLFILTNFSYEPKYAHPLFQKRERLEFLPPMFKSSITSRDQPSAKPMFTLCIDTGCRAMYCYHFCPTFHKTS